MPSVELSASWWAWFVPTTLQATLLLAAVAIVDRAARRHAWPQLLATLWWVALARLALPAELSSPWSITEPIGSSTLPVARLQPGNSIASAAFAIWALGMVGVFAARCVQRARLRSRVETVVLDERWLAVAQRAAARLGRRRLPQFGTLANLATPAVLGPWRTTLLLPSSWLERGPTRRDEHALLHELMHLKRGDLWLDELLALARAAFWFHPLVWIGAARLHALSELACDQSVAHALGDDARSYRDTLVLAARGLLGARAPHGARAFVAHASSIVARIERLDRAPIRSARPARVLSVLAATALAACVLPMTPSAAALRAEARSVFEAAERGERQSCFSLHAAAMVLAADQSSNPRPTRN